MTTIEVDDRDLERVEELLRRCDDYFDQRDRYSLLALEVDQILCLVKKIRGVA